MKNIIILALLGITLASCSKTEEVPSVICDKQLSCVDENCQFTINNKVGKSNFLHCYNSWAIVVHSEVGENSWYIVDEWDASYEEEGLDVTFCGYVRNNTLPLLLPDPMPGRFYQIDLEAIEKVDK